MHNINETTDYGIFKFFPENRCVKKFQKIKDSLIRRNMLAYHPIHVDRYMKIIDGQHRFLAAKELGLPIYYVIDKEGVVDDIAPLNSTGTLWNSNEFTDYYCKLEYPAYLFIRRIINKFNFPMFFTLCLCSSHQNLRQQNNRSTITKVYKEGRLLLKETEENLEKQAAQVFEIVNVLKEISKKITVNFYVAALSIIKSPGYNHETMMKKLNLHKEHIVEALRYKNITDIANVLKEKIYNNKLKYDRI